MQSAITVRRQIALLQKGCSLCHTRCPLEFDSEVQEREGTNRRDFRCLLGPPMPAQYHCITPRSRSRERLRRTRRRKSLLLPLAASPCQGTKYLSNKVVLVPSHSAASLPPTCGSPRPWRRRGGFRKCWRRSGGSRKLAVRQRRIDRTRRHGRRGAFVS